MLGGVEFESIHYSGGIVRVAGLTLTEVEVLEYAHKLDETNRFQEVIISNITIDDSEESDSQKYTITLILKGSR